jgi:hypothetical protein
MKIHIVSPDSQGRIEGVCMANILCHLPNRVGSINEANVVIVPVSYYGDYQFNEHLRAINKPVVLISFLEFYGQEDKSMTHILGVNHDQAWPNCGNPEWRKLDDWCRDANIVLRFTRELLAKDTSPQHQPIEWPCYMPLWEREPKASFDARPFEWIFAWGMSNHLRPLLHSQTFLMMALGKLDVISHWDQIDAKIYEPHKKALSIHSPHTHRIEISEIVRRQAQSKMSVSLPGAGKKCFRSTEHFMHTVPVKLEDDLAWSFPWVSGENCIILHEQDAMAENLLEESEHDLHPIYLEAQELASRYSIHRYLNEYILPAIQRVL